MLIQSKEHFFEMLDSGILKDSTELSTPPDYVRTEQHTELWLRKYAPPTYVGGYILTEDADDWFQTPNCSVVFCPKLAPVCNTPYAACTFNFIAYGHTPAEAVKKVMELKLQYP